MEKPGTERKHFVLIHGACHGAWCWYKVKTQLKNAGHHVTALDMAASGIDTRSIQDVGTMEEYSQPLLDFMEELPQGEKVVLVGHSLGGINIAVAMEKFPEKISVAVFLTAFLPDTVNPRPYVMQELFARASPGNWMDTIFTTQESVSEPPAIIHFGPEFMKQKFYQNSPLEDLELARMLTRPGSLYVCDLTRGEKFRVGAYGSVKRVYVVCGEDLGIPKEFQHWMIENYGAATDVMDIPNADHMAMLSTPEEVVKCLSAASVKYA
uniref:AB hydrolase-1 domain-containing protein n=1 Tax=Kalanchoe fedtschenkoi TaxID=63787 RepID=A0A7N0UEJ1_KALFE